MIPNDNSFTYSNDCALYSAKGVPFKVSYSKKYGYGARRLSHTGQTCCRDSSVAPQAPFHRQNGSCYTKNLKCIHWWSHGFENRHPFAWYPPCKSACSRGQIYVPVDASGYCAALCSRWCFRLLRRIFGILYVCSFFNHRLLYHTGVSGHQASSIIVGCLLVKAGYVTYTK